MKRFYVFILLAAMVLFGIYFYKSPIPYQAIQHTDGKTVDQLQINKSLEGVLPSDKSAISKPPISQKILPKNIQLLTDETVNTEQVIEMFGGENDLSLDDGRHLIKIDIQAMQTLKQGSHFNMYFKDLGESYNAVIMHEEKFEGIRRLTGYFDGFSDEDINQFSLTLSEGGQYLSANFSLKGHSFTSETKQGVGWINDVSNELDRLFHGEEQFHLQTD